jgi:PhnB protein
MPHDPNQGPSTGVAPHLTLRDKRASEAIDFYKKAFAAQELSRNVAQDGERLMHAHLLINGASVILNDDFPEYHKGSFNAVPGGFCIHLQVDNADSWFNRAVEAGATVRVPLQDMFWGDRYGHVIDPFGIIWSIAHRIEE